MGRPKPLLPWHDILLVEYQTSNLIEAGVAEVVVVLGHEHQLVAPHIRGPAVRYVVNSDYRQGKATSIRAGLRSADAQADGILLLAVDQPRPFALVEEIIEAHHRQKALITSPRYQGRGGHPLVFSHLLRGELEGVTEERQGIREGFRSRRGEVNEVEIEDPIVCLDLNSPEEYEEAKVRYGA